ncbi:hypothetical protein GBO31_18020 [Aquimarina litoralis]|nr:hypothetical protein [Aquimarina litoralis]
MYLSNHSYPATVSVIKIVFYGISIFSFLVAVIDYILEKDLIGTIRTFIISSIYSLIILGLIGFVLPKASQVNSIVVDLYENPFNMVLLLVLFAPLLAIVLVHYPSYFNIKERYRDWFLTYKISPIFGIITYKYRAEYQNHENKRPESNVNFLLRILGVVFYTSLFYLIAYTSEVNFKWLLDTADLAFVILACGVLWLYILRVKKQRWYNRTYNFILSHFPNMYDGDYSLNANEHKKSHVSIDPNTMSLDESKLILHSINPIIGRGIVFFLITVILHLVFFLILFLSEDKYTMLTVVLSLLCIIFQMISYVYYRTFRSILKFTFFSEKSKTTCNSFGNTSTDKLVSFFKTYNFSKNNFLFEILSRCRAGILSDNYTFLRVTVFIANINLAFFIVINCFDFISFKINAIVIILSALLIYYGILIIITKNIIYYQYSRDSFATNNKTKVKFGLLVTGLILLVLIGLTKIPQFNNNLFTLHPVKETVSSVDLGDFLNDREADISKTRYHIGCYGGGIKSNAWTMTVLRELQKQDPKFLNQTISISGASGGTMGLINFSSILHNIEKEKQEIIIDEVSTQNILGLDLTHILGRDLLMHLFIPKCDLSGYDRSSSAMHQYAKITNNKAFDHKKSYRAYWKKMYNFHNNHFPILISNTTNVKGNQGMAVSVSTNKNPEDAVLLYQGADDILSIGSDQTLSYYDAASTSNRFPLISPAAKIETLGHYNDGGIYDNSGLLSAYKLFNAINNRDSIQNPQSLKQCNVFISIVNDKTAYIKKMVNDKFACTAQHINENTEMNAILSSVASTEMMPIYVKEQLRRLENISTKIKFKTIYLPHQFTVADIKSIYGRELNCNNLNEKDLHKELYHTLVKKNDSIIATITNNGSLPIVEPPMSRVITKKAYQFMKDMLDHPETKKVLKEIRDTNK